MAFISDDDDNSIVEQQQNPSPLEDDTPDYAMPITCFQDGLMTYYHLFDTVNENDRFNIGQMLWHMSLDLELFTDDYPEAEALTEQIQEDLTELDAADPKKDLTYQSLFSDIFVQLGRIRGVLGFYDVE